MTVQTRALTGGGGGGGGAGTISEIVAGAGLTGSGLTGPTATLNVIANADGSLVVNPNDIQVGVLATDAQHGNRGGGTQHAVATGATAGFMSAADKAAHDALVATDGGQVSSLTLTGLFNTILNLNQTTGTSPVTVDLAPVVNLVTLQTAYSNGNNVTLTSVPIELNNDGTASTNLLFADTFTTGGAFLGGGILSNGTITYNNSGFIWALLQESKIYEAAAGPGFAAFTLFNALPTIRNSGNFDLVQAIVLNVGVAHERASSGTSNVVQTIGVSFAAQARATVSGAVLTFSAGMFGLQFAPKFSTVAGSTVNMGTLTAVACVEPAVALFQPQAGTENMTAYRGLDFPNMTFGGASATIDVIRSQLNMGTNKRFINHTGNAISRFRGHISVDVDAFGILLGASTDVLMRWQAAGHLSFFGFSGINSDLQISSPSLERFLFNTGGGSVSGQFNFNALKMSFGAQTGAVGNQKFAFVSGAETITVGGDYSGMLWTYAANDTINAALSLYATMTLNAGSPTIGTGSLTTNAILNIGGNPGSAATNRVGLRIISNPTGGAGINAALWVTAGLSRFDGRVDINRGVALGGGAAATLGTIGGSGPTTAAQAQWLEIDINGVAHWIPVWV